ncbi:SDR family NAD(P)-dependent oxidoreductase [Devosia sp.]|uniref:SDR family NAD(P)-dependent oxidoreductase n=1 Tax=Devosia sp. TaxID=1871048 RepID=UPI0035B2FB2A
MQIDLKGKVAIVTGAGRGIGRVIARTLAEEGVTVAIIDIRQDLLDDASMEWLEAGLPGVRILADVRDAGQVKAAVAAVDEQFGRIDILVNNAGVAAGARVDRLAEEVWDANFDTNTKGVFLMCQAVSPVMQRQGSGRIINAASFAAIIPSIGSAAYAASKSAVVQFTRVLAGELGPFNVTVNSYSPGMIPTDMNGYAHLPEARKQRLLDTLTLRRWGDPQDVANLVCFLASDLAAYISGASIDVSGGKFATQIPSVAYE